VLLSAASESVAVLSAPLEDATEQGELLPGSANFTSGSPPERGLGSTPARLGDHPFKDLAHDELAADIDHPAKSR